MLSCIFLKPSIIMLSSSIYYPHSFLMSQSSFNCSLTDKMSLYRVGNTNLLLQLLTMAGSHQRGIIQPMLAILMVSGYGLMIIQLFTLMQIRFCMNMHMCSSTSKC